MSNPAMLGMDARLRSVFKAAGWADDAVFRSQGVSVAGCTVLIDRGVQLIGDQSQVSNNHITLTCYPAQTGKLPQRGDTFAVGGEVFCIDSPPIEQDESAAVFIVKEQ